MEETETGSSVSTGLGDMRFRVVFKLPVCKASPACPQKPHSGITVLDRPTHLGPWTDIANSQGACSVLMALEGEEREKVSHAQSFLLPNGFC